MLTHLWQERNLIKRAMSPEMYLDSREEADKFLDDIMQGKSTEKVIVGASLFGSSESADAFLEDTKVQPQTKMTGTYG